MASRPSQLLLGFGLLGAILLVPLPVAAQRPTGGPPGGRPAAGPASDPGMGITARLLIFVRDESGGPIGQMALVTLSTITSGMYRQATTQAGQTEFDNLVPGRYYVQVVAPGYETVKEVVDVNGAGAMANISLEPSSALSSSSTPAPPGPPALSPKVQKLLARAREALRASKPSDARGHLEEAYRLAPGHPDVNFLFGVYAAQMNDWTRAKSYWERAVNIYPKHLGSLIYLSEALLRENKAAEAVPYLNRVMEAEPTAWRPHALMAQASADQGQYDDAIKQADRALELGHSQAAGIQPLLAHALVVQGNKERAITVLRNYLQDRPADAAAQKMLDTLRAPAAPSTGAAPSGPVSPLPTTSFANSSVLSSAWMPPDVDEKVPPVEPGVACPLDDVLRHASNRLTELVHNVDRFTATESLKHELINAYGLPSSPEMRTFNYLVSIEEVRPGYLNVDEYRDADNALEKFPDHVATLGLPSLVLVFHPLQVANFVFSCEGLTHSNAGLSWQVHFRQRLDKPLTLRSYRIGGRTFPIALKGRAWVAADSFQVVRLETDLMSPHPEIRLAGEHTAIEYGPVRFRNKDVSMWLPQTAEVYFDWRGQRIHRRHSFSNYLLFSVDDKQRITLPKVEETPAPDSSASSPQSNP